MNEFSLEYECDYSLFGVICSLKDYQIAYYMGRFFDVRFESQESINVLYKKGVSVDYTNYTAVSNSSCFRLIKNKAVNHLKKSKFIVPEYVEFDYLLQIDGEIHEWSTDMVVEELKEVNHFSLVKKIDLDQIELKENLIY